MEFLITLIGNAVVDPLFRERFLNDPVETADQYGFRLTKGEFDMMRTVFAKLETNEKDDLEQVFFALEEVLYNNLWTRAQKVGLLHDPKCPTRPCLWSVFPPPEPHELRQERETLEEAKDVKLGPAA